jgi:hypothetical protein
MKVKVTYLSGSEKKSFEYSSEMNQFHSIVQELISKKYIILPTDDNKQRAVMIKEILEIEPL